MLNLYQSNDYEVIKMEKGGDAGGTRNHIEKISYKSFSYY
ncbi:hypothetical protein VT91_35100 [Clostridium sporogenes]|uniref:Uncharacterized protein n=1 Tax=Clostridium sporogenes TaxID=1509 RepID=A0A1J1D0Y3_CLOSG|nr:hypothetical protein NPD7_598 [Clostridium sporogenes]STC81046.1 Uncharacterised protein [Clostridium botulinum]APH16071.1 hypothetical protein NPD5_3513 [Clostridium sporogenes]KRU23923.1 hypothetical protein VT91_35100 [Clostridium sporogenes]KRU28411.1 hypothetical protein VT28_22690 [Clostridium sporogenes]